MIIKTANSLYEFDLEKRMYCCLSKNSSWERFETFLLDPKVGERLCIVLSSTDNGFKYLHTSKVLNIVQ